MASHIELDCKVHFEHLNALLKKQVRDIRLHEQLTLHQVRVEGEDAHLIAYATVSGMYSGEVRIKCMPTWSREHQQIDLQELDVKLVSKNLLAKGASWMANNLMAKQLDNLGDEILNKEVGALIDKGLKTIEQFALPIGGHFMADSVLFDLKDLHTAGDALHFKLIIDGNTRVVV